MITITATALQEIQRIQGSRQQRDSYLRIGVTNGGCEGLIYTLNLEVKPTENQTLTECEGIKILLDNDDLLKLNELKVDYAEDLMGGGFRFQNPQAAKHCNCGQSFSLKS